MPFVFSHVEYCDKHFVYGFCNGNARAAVEEYQRRFPDHDQRVQHLEPGNHTQRMEMCHWITAHPELLSV
jgi:hypothetical protein